MMNELQLQRAAQLLETEFGPEWQSIAGISRRCFRLSYTVA